MAFRLLGADCADEVGVGDLAVEWDLGLIDEEDGAGAFYFVGLGAISADAVGGGSRPHSLERPLDQVFASVPRSSFLKETCLLAVGGVVARAEM